MSWIKKFKSETPRVVSFFQTLLLMVTSISGALTAAGVVVNPVVGTVVAVGSAVATGALQFTEKIKVEEDK